MGTYVSKVPFGGRASVPHWLSSLDKYAVTAVNNAGNYADRAAEFIPNIPVIDAPFSTIVDPNIQLSQPSEPDLPVYTKKGPGSPGSFSPQTVSHTTLPAPIFDIADMSLNIPDLPNIINDPTAPTKPNLELDQVYPDRPITILPNLPNIESIEIPVLQVLNIPSFLGSLPDASMIVVPGNTFSFSEVAYSDALLTKVKDELMTRLCGGTGLSPAVEDAIWNRGRDRESISQIQVEREVLTNNSQSGFTRPTGSSEAALDRAVLETQAKNIELSREITIKQADLEQENIKNSIQQTITLEDILIKENSEIQRRAFETAKLIQDISIELYKIAVNKYEIELSTYKIEAEVFKTLVEAEITKVAIFKAEVDAQLAIGQVNEQNVKVYTAQIDAIDTIISTYRTEVDAVSTRLQGEAIKIEAFKSEVEAYSTEIQANTEAYKGYSAQIQGELAKADIYKTQVSGFASKMQAYAIEQGAEDSGAQIRVAIEDQRLKGFLGKVEAYSAGARADQLNFQGLIDLYRGQASIYTSKTNFDVAAKTIELRRWDSVVQQVETNVKMALETLKLQTQVTRDNNALTLDGIKAAGSIQAQIGSSALNAINISSSETVGLSNTLGESYTLSGSI